MFELIGNADEEMIADAAGESLRVRRSAWIRRGAVAACICLLAAGALALAIREQRGYTMMSGGGGTSGLTLPAGSWPEGVDPITASIAVYPATENVQDVADAALRTITEEEALQFGELGRYLPRTLPEGWWFVASEIYETTMKDGSKYHLLRATYSRSDPADFDPEKPYLTDDCFMLQVLDYLPETKTMKIYTPEKLKLSQRDRDDFYLALDNVYIGVFSKGSIEVEELLQLIGVL